MANFIKTRIKNKINTKQNWQELDPVLLSGEIAIVIDNELTRIKVGDGVSTFNNLNYTSNAKHISYQDYAQLLKNNNVDPQILYVLSSDEDFKDCFGYRLKNIAAGIELSDAVNLEQLNNAISSIDIPQIPVNVSEFKNDANYAISSVVKTDLNNLSIGLTNKINDINIPTKVSQLENDNQYANISIDNNITTELKISHLSRDEYYQLITDDDIDPNSIYIVSSDNINMYNKRIENVGQPIDGSDAATKEYVDNIDLNLNQKLNQKLDQIEIPTKVSQLENDSNYAISSNVESEIHNLTNIFYKKTETSSAAQIDTLSTNLTNKINAISVPTMVSQLSNDANYATVTFDDIPLSNVNIKNVSQDEYHRLVIDGTADEGVFYIISSDTLNSYGERVENVGEPIEPTDATTKEYVDNNLSYKLVSHSVTSTSDSTINVQDRTITTITITDQNIPITVNLPKKNNDDIARDFILRFEIMSSTSPTISFNGLDDSWTVSSSDDDWLVIDPGVNVISFTEMKK